MQLHLEKPVVFFDVETTGLNVAHDRIVELSYIKVWPDGKEERQTLRFNPGRHISAESTAVNGIHDADVTAEPSFKDRAAQLAALFQDSDIAGFNSNRFDVPILVEEFARSGVAFDISKCRLIDVQTIYHKMEPRNLSAAYKYYCGQHLEDAHTAMADTNATYEVLKAQLEHYGEQLHNDMGWLSDFSRQTRNIDLAGRFVYDAKGVETVNFGKYRGWSVANVLRRDPSYYTWIMQGDFTQDTKQNLLRIKMKYGL